MVDTVISLQPYRVPFQYIDQKGLAIAITVKGKDPYLMSCMKNFSVQDVVLYICRIIINFGGTSCEVRRCPQIYDDGSREYLNSEIFYQILEALKPTLNKCDIHLDSVVVQADS